MRKELKVKAGKVIWTAFGLILVLAIATVVFAQVNPPKYMGADKCKSCHSSESRGNQYGKWKQQKHAKAFENLALDAAKQIGQKQGISDPQASDKCLKCHTTAYGVPKEQLDAKFDHKNGVQCEACHGPGEKHVKARMAAAASAGADPLGGQPAPVSKDEINAHPDAKVCTGCHNKESPNFTGFDFSKMSKEIAHPIPKKP
jgi:ribosomal protein L40E